MTTPTTDEVTAAEQEATEAEALLAALEEQVRDGDDTVTPQQLTEQRELGLFARLRADASQRKARRAVEQAEADRLADLRRQAVDTLAQDADRAALHTAYDQAVEALRTLVKTVDRHDAAVVKSAGLLMRAGSPQSGGSPEDMAGPPAAPDAPRWYAGMTGSSVSFGDGRPYSSLGPMAFLAAVISEVPGMGGALKPTRGNPNDLADRHTIRRYVDQGAAPKKGGK